MNYNCVGKFFYEIPFYVYIVFRFKEDKNGVGSFIVGFSFSRMSLG